MPDDRRGIPRPHLIADDAADRARAHDQRQAVPVIGYVVPDPLPRGPDDTVPLGRPPGVPRTVASDLAAEARAAVAAILAHAGATSVDITTSTSGGAVAIDIGAQLTARGVDRLLELAANLPATGR